MNKLVKSKRYKGVYRRKSLDGETTYYYTYKDEENKIHYQKVGTKSQGITESYVNDIRLNTVSTIKLGELPPKIVRNKSKYKITVDEISEYYFSTHITKSSEKRQRQYNYRLKPFFGEMNIFNVSVKDIDKFKEMTLKEVSEQTTILYLELLSTLFTYYSRKHQLNFKNPVLQVEKPRVDNKRERFLSKDEIRLVFDEVKDNFTLLLFLSLSLSTGGRKSTVMNYKIKDVDLTHKMINSYDFKNMSTYKSFLDDRTIELIKIRIEQSDNVNDPLVYHPDVKDLDRYISRHFKIIFDNLFNMSLEPNDRKNRVVVHTLRHTVLSHLGMKGTSEFIIKKISNHKSTQMVDRYVKLSEETGKKEILGLWE